MDTTRYTAALRQRFTDTELAALADEPDDPRCLDEHDARELYREIALAAHQRQTPAAFTHARADMPQVTAWADAYTTGRLGPRHSLLLLGTTGTGKTHQAYGALRRIAETGVPNASWAGGAVSQLLADLRPSGTNPDATFRQLTTARLLLLDDIGAEKPSQWTEETLLRLTDHRYAHRLPVIVTGNGAWQDIADAIGDRTASRLAGMCTLVEFKGEDRRWKP